jgi:hypothetical protein
MRKIWLVAALALSACGGKKSEEPQGDCAASVNHAIDLSKDDYK